MGLTGNLFEKKVKIDITSKMMEEDLFWSIIEKSLQNFSEQDQQERLLVKEL